MILMDMQNAIDYFKNYIEFCKQPDMEAPTLEPYEIAVKTMENQIPKKPIFKFIDGCKNKFYSCPECGSYVMSALNQRKIKHCMECGQAIDWSE